MLDKSKEYPQAETIDFSLYVEGENPKQIQLNLEWLITTLKWQATENDPYFSKLILNIEDALTLEFNSALDTSHTHIAINPLMNPLEVAIVNKINELQKNREDNKILISYLLHMLYALEKITPKAGNFIDLPVTGTGVSQVIQSTITVAWDLLQSWFVNQLDKYLKEEDKNSIRSLFIEYSNTDAEDFISYCEETLGGYKKILNTRPLNQKEYLLCHSIFNFQPQFHRQTNKWVPTQTVIDLENKYSGLEPTKRREISLKKFITQSIDSWRLRCYFLKDESAEVLKTSKKKSEEVSQINTQRFHEFVNTFNVDDILKQDKRFTPYNKLFLCLNDLTKHHTYYSEFDSALIKSSFEEVNLPMFPSIITEGNTTIEKKRWKKELVEDIVVVPYKKYLYYFRILMINKYLSDTPEAKKKIPESDLNLFQRWVEFTETNYWTYEDFCSKKVFEKMFLTCLYNTEIPLSLAQKEFLVDILKDHSYPDPETLFEEVINFESSNKAFTYGLGQKIYIVPNTDKFKKALSLK